MGLLGRKPHFRGSRWCSRKSMFQPFLFNLTEGPEGLYAGLPTPLSIIPGPGMRESAVEKNWMPFTHSDQLYFVHSIQPHRILAMDKYGLCRVAYETDSRNVLDKAHKGKRLHGGPPVIPIYTEQQGGGARSAAKPVCYLGIMHYFDYVQPWVRSYRHFAYKMHPEPPFHITAVSGELPLQFSGSVDRLQRDSSHVAFVNGLTMSPDGLLVVSYGSRDSASRVMTMSLSDLENLFSESVAQQ